MFNIAIKQLKTACVMFILLTVLTGGIYPLVVTGLAQLFFSSQANGSLLKSHEQIVGSLLIGQSFTEPRYFWGRPSATSSFPYNALASSGSNLGPLNSNFLTQVKQRVEFLKKDSLQKDALIPVDLVTASGSGLDPDISPLSAFYQVPRVAQARHISEQEIRLLIQKHMKERTDFILGEPRVNVLELNIAMDEIVRSKDERTATQSR